MKKIGKAFVSFLLHYGLIFLLFTVLRLLFYFFNQSYFPDARFINFAGGIRFDWLSITLVYAPFLLLFPFTFHKRPRLLKFLFMFSSASAIALNAIDFEYYKFTLKRTTADLFTTQGLATDLANLILTFLIEYWYVFVVASILLWLTSRAYNLVGRYKTERLSIGQSIVFFMLLLLVHAPGSRGGLQYRPLNVVNASAYAKAKNVAVVLNTPFTILKSAYKEDISRVNYYSENELNKIYTPLQSYPADSTAKKLNVVVLIAESFSKEYIGAFNEYAGYTPFLDSLIDQSLVFTNAFANGKKIYRKPACYSCWSTYTYECIVHKRGVLRVIA